MATRRFPTSSRTRRRRASSSSKRTPSPAATSSRRPSAADLDRARGKGLRDVLAPDLAVLFCGINPGLYSAATGFHFARPGNRFWPALHRSGFTPRLFHPSENRELLRHGCGLTNLVNRATAAADELSAAELVAGARRLAAKVRRYAPGAVVFVGLGAYRTAFGRPGAALGRQPETLEGAQVWVLPSPSGLNANYQLPALVKRLREVRKVACQRRSARRSRSSGP